jgi:hypothetical protein
MAAAESLVNIDGAEVDSDFANARELCVRACALRVREAHSVG